MARIFVSHAVKDEELVEDLVDLLQVGIGIHPDDIFCSSLPGMNIPTGTAFIDYIKSKVADPEIVLLVISPEFLKSQFCNNEVGASWALSLAIHPLLVPPTDYSDVRSSESSLQGVPLASSQWTPMNCAQHSRLQIPSTNRFATSGKTESCNCCGRTPQFLS